MRQYYYIFIFIFCFKTTSVAQDLSGFIRKEKYCIELNSIKKTKECISCYEKLKPEFPNQISIYLALCNLYYSTSNFIKLKENARQAARINEKAAYETLLNIATQLSEKKEKETAIFILDQLLNYMPPGIATSKLKSTRADFLLQKYVLESGTYPITFQNLGDSINSNESEYLPSLSIDNSKMVFTRRIQGANEDFFISEKDSNGNWTKAKNMGYPPNTSNPDGAAMLSADGNYIFFTRCDQRSGNGITGGGCDLFYCFRENNSWSAPQLFGYTINTSAYEGQPCLSSDNKKLYFSSDREGGFGGKDIWVSTFENNVWNVPINLGKNINTSGDETSPFIHADNETLYFSSTGHPGLGLSDLFVSRKIKDSLWMKAVNLGSPINSTDFDGSIFVNSKGSLAYSASDREKGKGLFDIYSFEPYPGIKPIPTLALTGKIIDKYTKESLKNVSYTVYDLNEKIINNESKSNKGDASYTEVLHLGKNYLIEIKKNNYRNFYKKINLRIDTFKEIYSLNLKLRKPGYIDTLHKCIIKIDSNSIDELAESKEFLRNIKNNWAIWKEDSADVVIFLKTYYYYGDSDTDTLQTYYVEQCNKRVDKIRQYFIKNGIDCELIMDQIDNYIWRDEKEFYEQVQLDVVEFY